ncbi:alpha/beta hydrolase [Hymenobacter sp. BT491]|nr:alpha/beta hydrolase [Hymenobacter sp. BT491]
MRKKAYFRLKSLLVAAFTIVSFSVEAQQKAAERDTSFTVHSAYVKAKKQYPAVSIATPKIPAGVASKRDLTYCTIGNRDLKLDIFYPTAKRKAKYPAVLLIHGGGWRSGDRSHHIPMAQQLAGKGYVTVTAEYRLSTEAIYPAAVNDLKAAVRWMRANANAYAIDTTKIAVWGFSAGGQLAALMGSTNGDKRYEVNTCNRGVSSNVQAVVDVDGILAFIHPESGEGDDSKSTSAATYWFGASKSQKPELWQEASALNHVSGKMPPILFINSSVDRMHAGRTDFISKLNELKIYNEVHAIPDTPHTFPLFNPWFEPTLNYTAAFLSKVLNGK